MYFARHGQSALNAEVEAILGGDHINPLLTPIGEWQMLMASIFMSEADIHPDTVVHSPADRAAASARLSTIFLPELPDLLENEELREANWGEWQGWLKTEVFTPEFEARAMAGGLDFRPNPTAETVREVGTRMLETAQGIDNPNTLVVSHNLPLKSMIGVQLGWTRQEIIGYKIPNATLLQFDPCGQDLPVVLFTPPPSSDYIDVENTNALLEAGQPLYF